VKKVDVTGGETNTGVRGAGQGAFDPQLWLPLEHLSPQQTRQNPRSSGGELVGLPAYVASAVSATATSSRNLVDLIDVDDAHDIIT
jgi:hypothetical protein